MLMWQTYLSVLFLVITISSVPVTRGAKTEECKCMCSGHSSLTVCESLDDIRLEIDANTEELKKWAQFFPFVQNLRNKWREEIISIVETEMKKYVVDGKTVPKPENLIRKLDEEMMNDSSVVPKAADGGDELAKDVSSLLAKVEMVENRTMEVEEELKSERRVRRHLEQEVKETQTSLITLEDQFQNATVPMDAIMSHVQMVIFTSLEDMNRTIYEDHLKKLYYKVDGVVYKNETRKLDERIDHVETELHDDRNSSIVSKLADDVKNLEEDLFVLNNSIADDLVLRIMMLETETAKKEDIEEMEHKMANLLNYTEQFRTGLADVSADIQDVQSFQQNLHDFSEEWSKSLEALQSQMETLKNKTPEHRIDNYVVQARDEVTNADEYPIDTRWITTLQPGTETTVTDEDWDYVSLTDEVTPSVANRIRIGGDSDNDNSTCDVPVMKDLHLMADVENGDGIQSLIFGCRPIGRYVVSNTPVPVRCEDGSWRGPFPSCQQLPDETTIESFAQKLKKKHPCSNGISGEFLDPEDCSRFFKCSHGLVTVIRCPPALHFNPLLKVCDYPKVAGCVPVRSELAQELQDIIPPVIIEPNNLDKPSGLLGTGTAGQLVVHPRSSFTLHCLYPENAWGIPTWNVTYFNEIRSRDPIPKEGKNKISLTVTAATEDDSGFYQCHTPFGKVHRIHVIVKAVRCPPLQLDDEYEDMYYRPTPEGEHRILGTIAEFPCDNGKKIFAVCMANGNWSRGPPEGEECSLKRRKALDTWNCLALDTSGHPDLILERNDLEKIVIFKCAGRLKLIGHSFTRCLDDGFWSHTSLPRCK